MNLLKPIQSSEQFTSLRGSLEKGGAAAIFGVLPIHCAAFAATLADEGRSIILICENDGAAATMAADITAMGVSAAHLPARDFVFLDVESTSHDLELDRLSALGAALAGNARVVCGSIEAVCQYTLPPEIFRRRSTTIERGGTIELGTLTALLVSAGYSRADRVEGRGQFAVHGGIVDIFPAASEHPVRIELFGDEIDRIAVFDEETQRRMADAKSAVITPVREVAFDNDGAAKLRAIAKKHKTAEQFARLALRDAESLENGLPLPACDRWLFAAYDDEPATALDYLPDAAVFICESGAVRRRHKSLLELHSEELASLIGEGMLPKKQKSFYYDDIEALWAGRARIFSDTFTRSTDEPLSELINVRASAVPRWSGELVLLEEDLRAGQAQNYACVVLAATDRAASALADDLSAAGFSVVLNPNEPPAPPAVGVGVGSLSSGFMLASGNLCVITTAKETKQTHRRHRRSEDKNRAMVRLEDLRVGDLVVHDAHGIGRFEGIQRIDHHGFVRDYIKLAYRGGDTLFVPVTQLDMVSQYISPKDDEDVKLAKLHSGEWAKTKAAVYRSVREMADELIALYSKREHERGVAFSADGEWQQSFESRFPYEETDDQLTAAEEIKRDMERSRPMDRVLCGDVGVGKTEVAMRAAFKCVNDGYQVAVLVPTTILAWQHYRTFCERMEAFPINVAMLSRFTARKDMKAAVEGIKNGRVDIAIGTHRLLQKDVDFKRLGLLIIDEEQRFGVAHKEKLKQKFAGVDVLTLSATPIPRTLNMALQGIRDMSVINEPPEDRHPVQTFVVEHDEAMLCDAIRRELARGGQVYYLHNRVDTIDLCAERLREKLPDARIETAHGKMDEAQLSDVWRRLLGGEIDVLVCTTIIETGVDVPNCNTLIVENADRMGLSQLYQIRGRVGRSSRRAFAYFTFRRDKVLSEVASKRLTAIRDFTSFGSGFKIAMRDLQIRGAGSVLSARQSGHMQQVGYDTYLKILAEAVDDAAGVAKAPQPVECTVDLAISAYLPDSYISDNESRIELYKRIAAITSFEDYDDVIAELRDRFGAPPEEARALAEVSLIRALGSRLFIYEITARDDGALVFFTDSPERLSITEYAASRRRKVFFTPKGKSCITAVTRAGERPTEVALEVLQNIRTVETVGQS